jgi:HK97 family phage major capsid protein
MDDVCQHGYTAACAECRRAEVLGEQFERFKAVHDGRGRAGWLTRRSEIQGELAQLESYARRSNAQDERMAELISELTVLGSYIDEDDVRIRSEKLEQVKRAAADPANRESGVGGEPPGAPAFVPGGLRDRVETAAEVIQRAGNPWRDHDGGPITYRAEGGQGYISRCHDALEAIESTVGHDGAEKLARVLAEQDGWPGMVVKRSQDERVEAARLFLALSNPYYAQAFRSVLRYPMEFMAGGTGFETLSPEEREAWREVRTNDAVRASFAESSGATGAFALPLQLDDTIILTNAGAAGPFRRLGRTVVGTSNTWNGVTSAGVTAVWAAEAAPVSDATPAIGQLVVTPYKEAAWITGSLEVIGDTNLDRQVPALIADSRTRLEATAFVTGSGTGQPWGVVTRAASDTTTGALAASHIYALLAALGPRFRVYDAARPVFMANIANINVARQIAAFSGANFSIVNDNGDAPRMLGLPFEEASAMSAINTVGAKNLLIGDLSQYVIVDRLPTVMIFEPLIFNATPLPTGQQGWFYYARVGADVTTAGAAFGANAFNLHTV